ncbi:MAG: hypothetical protein ABII22_06525 [Candidatus Micrarchaeota archaeon]
MSQRQISSTAIATSRYRRSVANGDHYYKLTTGLWIRIPPRARENPPLLETKLYSPIKGTNFELWNFNPESGFSRSSDVFAGLFAEFTEFGPRFYSSALTCVHHIPYDSFPEGFFIPIPHKVATRYLSCYDEGLSERVFSNVVIKTGGGMSLSIAEGGRCDHPNVQYFFAVSDDFDFEPYLCLVCSAFELRRIDLLTAKDHEEHGSLFPVYHATRHFEFDSTLVLYRGTCLDAKEHYLLMSTHTGERHHDTIDVRVSKQGEFRFRFDY